MRSIVQKAKLAKLAITLGVCLGIQNALPVISQEKQVTSKSSTSKNSKGIALTIYNQNFGLVKDVREVELDKGINFLRFADVAAAIDPTTVNFLSLTAPNSVVVREQNYQYDVMDRDTILNKLVGETITLKRYTNSGGTVETTGELLNPPIVTIVDTNGNPRTKHSGIVLKTSEGIVVSPGGELNISKLPADLVPKPALLWKLEATRGGVHDTEISYQTKGIKWRCDYVAVANADDTKADLTSWVTIDNKTGTSYKNAALKLLAGDVHRVTPSAPRHRSYMMKTAMAESAMANQFSEKTFAEYHLYSLAGTTNVNNNETKQMSLFNANGVPTKKLYIFEPQGSNRGVYGGQNNQKKVNVKLEIDNTQKNNLGMALPKGKVRVYKKDSDGALQFVGEDQIDHTPRDEKVRLYIGDAFDLVGERKQLAMTRPSKRVTRASFQISLRNHKDEDVEITAIEHAYGDWKIKSSSHKYKKTSSTKFEFTVKVPKRGETLIDYEIETRY